MKKSIFSFAFFFLLGMINVSAQQNCCPNGTIPGPNLILNGDFEAGNVNFGSDLNFLSACGNTSYDVGNVPTDKCTAGGWLSTLGDHTSGSGLYMLIDGPSQANSGSNRVWRSSATVAANTWYSFEFFLRPSITTSSNPNLRLQVNIGGTNVSGTIDPPNNNNWVRYCYRWLSPSQPVSVLMDISQIINFGHGGYDYGLDDISFVQCDEPDPPCEVYSKWKADVDPETCKVTFDNVSAAGPGTTIVGYQWDFGDGQTSTDFEPCHFYDAPGIYYVCLTVYGVDENGECCVDTYCDKVVVDCEPGDCKIDIRKYDIKYSINNCAVSIYADVVANRPIIGYYWDFGDGSSGAGSNPQSHTFPSSGSYWVCVTVVAADGEKCCSATFCDKVVVECHDDDIGGDAYVQPDQGEFIPEMHKGSMRLTPNPASDLVSIDFESKKGASYDLYVTSIQGQTVIQKTGESFEEQSNTQIDASQLAPGTYIVSIIVDGQLLTEKLIIR